MARSAGLRPSPMACSTCWPCSWRTSRPSRSSPRRPAFPRTCGPRSFRTPCSLPASALSCSCFPSGAWAAGCPSSWASASPSSPWLAPSRRPRATGRSWERSSSAASSRGCWVCSPAGGGASSHPSWLLWWWPLSGSRCSAWVRPPSAAVPVRKISAAPRTSSSAPSRFWRASRFRASPRALRNSFRCSSDSSWGIWWPFLWAKWTSPVSLRRSSSRCRECCP